MRKHSLLDFVLTFKLFKAKESALVYFRYSRGVFRTNSLDNFFWKCPFLAGLRSSGSGIVLETLLHN